MTNPTRQEPFPPDFEELEQLEVEDAAPGTPSGERVNYGRGFLWNFVFNFFVKVLSAVVGIFIANKLGPGPVGIYALMTTVYNQAELMRDAGLKQAYNNDPELTPAKQRTYGRLSLISGLSFGIILAALAYPVTIFYRIDDLWWCMLIAAGAIAINGLSSIPVAVLLKAGKFKETGFVEGLAALASNLVAVTFVFLGYGLLGLMLQLLVRSIVLFGCYQRLEPLKIRDHDREAVKPIMRICRQLVTTDLLWMTYFIADTLIIPKRIGEVANGVYGWGKRLIWMPTEIIFVPVHKTITIAVGNQAGKLEQVGKTYLRSLTMAVLLLLPIYIGLAIFASPIVHAILKPSFNATAAIVPILCLADAARAITSFGGTALVAAQKPRIPMFSWIVPYPITLTILWLNWSKLDLTTTAWAFAAGMLSVCVIVTTFAFNLSRSGLPEKQNLLRAVATTATSAAFGLILYIALTRTTGSAWIQALTALAVLPLAHLIVCGVVFGGGPKAYLSLSGLKRLRTAI